MLPRGERAPQPNGKGRWVPHLSRAFCERVWILTLPVPTTRSIIPRMLGGRTSEQWIAQYASTHQHPVNRACHTLGIPTILVSVAVFIAGFFFHRLWLYPLLLFLILWLSQSIAPPFQ